MAQDSHEKTEPSTVECPSCEWWGPWSATIIIGEPPSGFIACPECETSVEDADRPAVDVKVATIVAVIERLGPGHWAAERLAAAIGVSTHDPRVADDDPAERIADAEHLDNVDAEITASRGEGFVLYDDHPLVAQAGNAWNEDLGALEQTERSRGQTDYDEVERRNSEGEESAGDSEGGPWPY